MFAAAPGRFIVRAQSKSRGCREFKALFNSIEGVAVRGVSSTEPLDRFEVEYFISLRDDELSGGTRRTLE